jgi:hypothetical protein
LPVAVLEEPKDEEKGLAVAAGAAAPKVGPARFPPLEKEEEEEKGFAAMPALDALWLDRLPVSIVAPGESMVIAPLFPKVGGVAAPEANAARESTEATPNTLVVEAPPNAFGVVARGGLPAAGNAPRVDRDVPEVEPVSPAPNAGAAGKAGAAPPNEKG